MLRACLRGEDELVEVFELDAEDEDEVEVDDMDEVCESTDADEYNVFLFELGAWLIIVDLFRNFSLNLLGNVAVRLNE